MQTYVVIDLETTGLDPEKDQITQISAIKYTKDGNQIALFNTYVQLTEGRKPSEYTPHITEELCSTGMAEEVAVLALDHFIDGSIMVIQYAPFDLSFIHWKHPDGDQIEEFYDFVCTRTLAKVLYPDSNPSLGPTAERLGIKNNRHHDAVNDCEVTWKVFSHIKEKIKCPKSEGFSFWHNTVMDFIDRPLSYHPSGTRIIIESETGRGY
ncbi:PolC-type DNA polymerase III [Bacillus licheniformis]|uniref:3'-5' exonuclease n=1 Tax=Bacillus licheniformis TaxID=1402 RepID=UPI0009B79242|nr:3'-5' exonuclease [Bacillus licheniformis]ARC72594.1 DNA polymerase III PolC-type [Bacillus licheniformis]ARW56579.1 DNA-directed DNA polymerase [Bacillus licheniformis]AXF87848.1 3'-5' exonuclease [Bacillus licheniformis]